MKKIVKHFLKLGLIVTALFMILTGCSGENSEDAGNDQDAASSDEQSNETPDVEDIDSDFSEITVVTSGGGLPHSYIDENSNWTGLDADVWAEIGKRKGWTVNHSQTEFAAIFGELTAERANVASNGLGITEERTENFDPSIPYYASVNAFGLSESNEGVKTLEDLADKKVAVETGGATEPAVRELSEEIGFEVVNYEDSSAALNDLGLGRIDAFANDETYIRNYAEETGIDIDILDEKISSSNVGFFYLPDSEESQKLKEEVDVVIQEMLDDGTLAELTTQWLGDDMTQYIE